MASSCAVPRRTAFAGSAVAFVVRAPTHQNRRFVRAEEGFEASRERGVNHRQTTSARVATARREWIGTMRYRAYATNAAIASSTNVIAAELISSRTM